MVGHWQVTHDLKKDMLLMTCVKEYPIVNRFSHPTDYLRDPKFQIQSLIYRILE